MIRPFIKSVLHTTAKAMLHQPGYLSEAQRKVALDLYFSGLTLKEANLLAKQYVKDEYKPKDSRE